MQTLQLRVINIQRISSEAILVTLKEINGEAVQYQAGQFLTFLIDFHGKELRRSYSISSTPGIDQHITILVKRVENGAVSRYLIEHLLVGDVLHALQPAGRFTLHTDSNNIRTLFFLAAGSGISPVYSLLKKLLAEEPLSRALLVYQNRDEPSTIFRNELEMLTEKYKDRLIIIHLLSNPIHHDHIPQRLNNSLLERLIGAYLDVDSPHDFYICGPSAFMRMIQFVLRVMGVSDEHVRKENFVIEPLAPMQFVLDSAPKQVAIHWKETVFRFSVSYPETILHAALKNNIQLPYSCKAGRCSSCALLCLSGKVKMSINEVLTGKDLREGLVLTCVGYAETDLELRV